MRTTEKDVEEASEEGDRKNCLKERGCHKSNKVQRD